MCSHLLSSGISYPLSTYSIPAGTAIVRSNLDRPVFDDSLLNSSRNSFALKREFQLILFVISLKMMYLYLY